MSNDNYKSKYKGVSYIPPKGEDKDSISHSKPWRAIIRIASNEQKIIGMFHTEEEAARAYDSAARTYYGNNALLNFPNEGEQSCFGENGEIRKYAGEEIGIDASITLTEEDEIVKLYLEYREEVGETCSVKEAAKLARYSTFTINNEIQAGKIKHTAGKNNKNKKKYTVDVKDLARWRLIDKGERPLDYEQGKKDKTNKKGKHQATTFDGIRHCTLKRASELHNIPVSVLRKYKDTIGCQVRRGKIWLDLNSLNNWATHHAPKTRAKKANAKIIPINQPNSEKSKVKAVPKKPQSHDGITTLFQTEDNKIFPTKEEALLHSGIGVIKYKLSQSIITYNSDIDLDDESALEIVETICQEIPLLEDLVVLHKEKELHEKPEREARLKSYVR